MDFRILGPLEVSLDGRAVPLGGKKQRALLALLLLHANEALSSDRLIDELWGESPPETVTTMLQVYISRLRKALGAERIVTRAPGYLLHVEPGELDLERFESLAAAGREALSAAQAAAAAERLHDALSLWRGAGLADFASEPFAQREIGRLEELRLATLEERIEADLALGRHAELVGELEALVQEHPLRERLRGQLMLALYRSGRQAEALEAYQETRRTLVEELGIEPSRTLQELERAILNQDSELDSPASAQQPRPDDRSRSGTVFVGREQELGELLAGLAEALRGSGRLFLLSGEPGIGKSRLADELVTRARERGARILVGRCWEAGGAPAYWPWVQSLRSYVREVSPGLLASQLGRGAPDVAQILPELRELLPDLPVPPPLDPEAARFRLFDSVSAFVRSAAAARPIVLVLDDLHAADTPSLLLLELLARQLAEARLLVLGAYRDVDPTLGEALSSSLAELAREPATRLLALSRLGEPDVASFIQLSAGVEAPETLVAAIYRETEGNPLFVGEVVRLLAAEGRLEEPGTLARLAVPQGVRAVIGRRLRRLSDECRHILTLASVLGREFALDALEGVSGLSGDELLETLDEAVGARVVTEVPGALARLRFAHALIRDTLYDELPKSRRVRLHRQVGEGLESLYSQSPEPHLAELAHHFFEAAPGGNAARAVEYARRAGDRAVALLAYEEAVRLYRTALEALDLTGVGEDKARCELLLALGDAQARGGDGAAAKETFLRAAELARTLDAPVQLGRAALGYGGRFVWAAAGSDRRLVELLEEALERLGTADSTLRVRLLARLAGALRDQHAREPRATLSREAVEAARRLGDPPTLAYALDGRFCSIMWPENPEERIGIASELMRVAKDAGEPERALAGRYYRTMTVLELGDLPSVKTELEIIARLAEELRQPAQLWLVVVTRATLAIFEGRFAEAEQLIVQALALGRRAQASDAVLSHRIQLFALHRERGGLESLEEMIARSIDEFPARPLFRCLLASLQAELGRESEARAGLEDLAADDFAALPLRNEWLFSMGFLAEVAGSLGDARRAATMYKLLLPYAGRNACTADYICTGSVSRSLGVLAATMSRWNEGARHFEDALDMNAHMGARPWVARTQHDYARMLLARDGPGDRERAGELLDSALARAKELGMIALERKVTALVGQAGAVEARRGA